jgi:hypothetical protein
MNKEQARVLIRVLHDIIESDRYPFSPRIRRRSITSHRAKVDTGAGG